MNDIVLQSNSPSRNKKPSENNQLTNTTYKSPYFASVRRNPHINKHRSSGQPQNALQITKYPSVN